MMKKRILFIDDDELVLRGLMRLLRGQESEWEMHFVESADKALELTRWNRFDAIVSDGYMPGKDGFELLLELRRSDTSRNVPVTILTGFFDNEKNRRALDLGAVDMLAKPVTAEVLVSQIGKMLDRGNSGE